MTRPPDDASRDASASADASDLRLAWGLTGAREAVAAGARTVVVVDVLSFSTTLSVAVDLGTTVLPHAYDGSAAFALRHGATLARSRHHASAGEASLSPVSLRHSVPVERLVLPSPNGSTICRAVREEAQVAAGCLRNAAAVGRWLAEQHGTGVVVAAGEHWPDGTLRPALEDLLGAGAVLAAALTAGPMRRPDADATAAIAAYHDALPRIGQRLRSLPSSRELAEQGYAADVEVALELDASGSVPVLRGEGFVARRP